MPESIDIHIKNIQTKLQILLKKHGTLEKEKIGLIKDNEVYKLNEKKLSDKINLLEQQNNILKTSAGKLEGDEKKEFEKSINQYIRTIEKCIGMLNN